MIRGLWTSALLLLGAGCLGTTTSGGASATTGAVEPESWPRSGRVAPAVELAVEVQGAEVLVGGRRVESDTRSIQLALMRESSLNTVLKVRTLGAADDAVLGRVVGEAAQAPALKVELSLGELRLTLLSRLRVVRESTDLLVFVSRAGTKLKAARNAETLAELEVGDTASEKKARAVLERLCEGKRCTSEMSLEPGAPLVPTLLAWQRVFGDREQTLKISPPAAEPPQPEAQPAAGGEKVSGRLPPEEIQGLVRQRFGKFRECYEAGLARNARLMGLMTVRFVIGRDGKVSEVQDFGSNIPDLEVRQCVLRAFKEIVFRPPTGGIVTVVYPITLMPD